MTVTDPLATAIAARATPARATPAATRRGRPVRARAGARVPVIVRAATTAAAIGLAMIGPATIDGVTAATTAARGEATAPRR